MTLFGLSRSSRIATAIAIAVRVVGAALVVGIGLVHLHLWNAGYSQIPKIGTMFLANALVSFVLGAAVLAWPRLLVLVAGIVFAAGTLGALIVSVNRGLFGFHELSGAPFVTVSIVLEAAAIAWFGAWSVSTLRLHRSRSDATGALERRSVPTP